MESSVDPLVMRRTNGWVRIDDVHADAVRASSLDMVVLMLAVNAVRVPVSAVPWLVSSATLRETSVDVDDENDDEIVDVIVFWVSVARRLARSDAALLNAEAIEVDSDAGMALSAVDTARRLYTPVDTDELIEATVDDTVCEVMA